MSYRLLMKHIPENLEECFEELKTYSNLDEFKNGTEDDTALYHFGLGMHLRNSWGLWDENSILHTYFKEMGLWHADDMSGLIFLSFHRHLNDKELKLDEQIEHYKKWWRENEDKRRNEYEAN